MSDQERTPTKTWTRGHCFRLHPHGPFLPTISQCFLHRNRPPDFPSLLVKFFLCVYLYFSGRVAEIGVFRDRCCRVRHASRIPRFCNADRKNSFMGLASQPHGIPPRPTRRGKEEREKTAARPMGKTPRRLRFPMRRCLRRGITRPSTTRSLWGQVDGGGCLRRRLCHWRRSVGRLK